MDYDSCNFEDEKEIDKEDSGKYYFAWKDGEESWKLPRTHLLHTEDEYVVDKKMKIIKFKEIIIVLFQFSRYISYLFTFLWNFLIAYKSALHGKRKIDPNFIAKNVPRMKSCF